MSRPARRFFSFMQLDKSPFLTFLAVDQKGKLERQVRIAPQPPPPPTTSNRRPVVLRTDEEPRSTTKAAPNALARRQTRATWYMVLGVCTHIFLVGSSRLKRAKPLSPN